MSLPKLDHVVINVGYDMDEAQTAFQTLGFQLTDRGYHTLGSINHLMMFDEDYLELIGLPADSDRLRPRRADIATAYVGINGIVFKSANVDATYAHLKAIGMDGAAPKSFSRPVEIDGQQADARFRTVTLRDDVFPGGRVYFCEHLTPELVWRPAWQKHGNGARRITEVVVVSAQHQQEAENFATLLQSVVTGEGDTLTVALDGAELTVMTPAAYQARFGALASDTAHRSSIFGAIVMASDDLEAATAGADRAGLMCEISGDGVVVREARFDSVLIFTEAKSG